MSAASSFGRVLRCLFLTSHLQAAETETTSVASTKRSNLNIEIYMIWEHHLSFETFTQSTII